MTSPIGFLMIAIIPVISIFVCLALSKQASLNPPNSRYTTIDGLRGYLAIFVFIHHAQVWYSFLRTDTWKEPECRIFTHLGQSSVSLFFMITAFLFYSKILESKEKPIDWARVWISRATRLFPAYIVSIGLLVLIVMHLSQWHLNVGTDTFAVSLLKWLTFTVRGYADINGIEKTHVIDAGVTWSLPYEWMFYFSLPVIARCIGLRPPLTALAISICMLLSVKFWHVDAKHSMAFLGGFLAAHCVRIERINVFAKTQAGSVVSMGLLIATALFSSSAYKAFPVISLSIAFTLIACGSDFFGILRYKGSRLLGEITYSIYLLHGIVLFVVFNLLIGVQNSKTFTPLSHWLVVCACTPLVVLISMVSFKFIEQPGMKSTDKVLSVIRTMTRKKTSLSD